MFYFFLVLSLIRANITVLYMYMMTKVITNNILMMALHLQLDDMADRFTKQRPDKK